MPPASRVGLHQLRVQRNLLQVFQYKAPLFSRHTPDKIRQPGPDQQVIPEG